MEKTELESPIKTRLSELAKAKGISERKLSQRLGKDPSYVKSIRGDITLDVLRKILLEFPDVNILYFLTGEGEILRPYTGNDEKGMIEYLINNNKVLNEKIEELNKEIGRLQERLSALGPNSEQ